MMKNLSDRGRSIRDWVEHSEEWGQEIAEEAEVTALAWKLGGAAAEPS